MRYLRTLCELAGLELNLRFHRTLWEGTSADLSHAPGGANPTQFADLCSLKVSPKSAGVYLLRLFKMNLATRSKDSWAQTTKPPFAYSVSKQGRSYLAHVAEDSGKDVDAIEVDEERVYLHALGALMRTRRYDETKHLYCYYESWLMTDGARSYAEDMCRKANRADTDWFLADIRQGVRAPDICRYLLDNLKMPSDAVKVFCGLHQIPFSNNIEKEIEPPKPIRPPQFIRDSERLKKNAMSSIMLELLL